MKFLVVIGFLCICSANAGLISYTHVVPGAPIGPDGRVVDTPEVALAKAEHAAAHINEKLNLKAASAVAYAPAASYIAPVAYSAIVPGAPIGLDGRVQDTPEVAHAKAEHAAAHINEKINHINEAAKSADIFVAPAVHHAYLL